MADFNKVILLGRITRDIEVRSTRSGTSVTEIGLAVNERRKGASGDWEEVTTFVDVTLWGRTAEIAGEWLGKGSQIMIEGRLKFDTWEKDGQKRSKLSVVGDKMIMIGSKNDNRGGGGGGGNSSGGSSRSNASNDNDYQSAEPAGPPDDDIPF